MNQMMMMMHCISIQCRVHNVLPRMAYRIEFANTKLHSPSSEYVSLHENVNFFNFNTFLNGFEAGTDVHTGKQNRKMN